MAREKTVILSSNNNYWQARYYDSTGKRRTKSLGPKKNFLNDKQRFCATGLLLKFKSILAVPELAKFSASVIILAGIWHLVQIFAQKLWNYMN